MEGVVDDVRVVRRDLHALDVEAVAGAQVKALLVQWRRDGGHAVDVTDQPAAQGDGERRDQIWLTVGDPLG